MKHGSISTHLKQKNHQMCRQQLVKAVQSDQKLSSGLARLWHPYFGTRTVFLFIDCLEKCKTIKSDYHMDQMSAAIKKKVLFYQDNASCHKSMKTMVKLNELRFELLPHPPYSPDLAPSDYWLFADLKKML